VIVIAISMLGLGIQAAAVSADPVAANGTLLLSGAAAVRFSPPTLVDLNGDGKQEILVGTWDGKVYAIRYINTSPYLQILWSRNTASDMGCATAIRGAISAADLDGDGSIEVVVPIGEVNVNVCGGLVVLDGLTGSFKWRFTTYDTMVNTTGNPVPDGLSDQVISTPALGDLDNDGKLEIVFGGFDQRVYVLRFDGTLFPGWPRFVRDTTFASPALADLDNDGFLEIILGVDTHQEGPPFNTPNGGGLYVFRADGTVMSGWPQFIGQNFYSSASVGDINGDGMFEIVIGTGELWNNPTDGNHIYVWNSQGTLLWRGNTTGYVTGSPALGDIDGDGKLEVVVGSKDTKLYAWNHDGSVLWSVTPTNFQGNTAQLGSPALADYNNDGKPDAFINILWDSAILNGPNGSQLTANSFPGNPLPAYVAGCTTQDNAPAIGDIDGDGKLELVLASGNNGGANCGTGQVFFWRLNVNAPTDLGNTNTVPWPMFGQNARHTRVYPKRFALDAEIVSHTIPAVMTPGEQRQISITVRNTGTTTWTTAALVRLGAVGDSDPFTATTRINLNAGEQIALGQTKTFTLTLQAPSTPGYYTTDWRMVSDSAGQWFGRTAKVVVKVSNQPALHVLTTQGMYAGGLATTPFSPPSGFWNWNAAKLWRLTYPDKRGYYMLDSEGGYWYGGLTFPLVSKGPVSDLRDMVLGPDGISYYELLGNGTVYGCDPAGCNRTFNPATPTGILARSLALTGDGKGVYVVDGYGNLYRGGNAPLLTLPAGLPTGSDIIRRIKLTPNGTGFYLMDMYGRIWNGGSAPVLTLGYSPHIGEDWARDFELTEDGTGFYLLAKDGSIYSGGSVPPLNINVPPTWPNNDVARDLELVDSRGYSEPVLYVSPPAINVNHTYGNSINPTFSITIANIGGPGTIDWTATPPTNVTLSATSGSVSTSTVITGTVLAGGYITGTHSLGSIVINGTIGGVGAIKKTKQSVAGSPVSVPVTLYVNGSNKVYLPLIIK
jgi:hypothetical protein